MVSSRSEYDRANQSPFNPPWLNLIGPLSTRQTGCSSSSTFKPTLSKHFILAFCILINVSHNSRGRVKRFICLVGLPKGNFNANHLVSEMASRGRRGDISSIFTNCFWLNAGKAFAFQTFVKNRTLKSPAKVPRRLWLHRRFNYNRG